MLNFIIKSDDVGNPVSWGDTLGAVLFNKMPSNVLDAINGATTPIISKEKTRCFAIISFVVAALALVILAIALGALLSVPFVTPLATAAVAAVAVGGSLSQGFLIGIASAMGAICLGGLIAGGRAADVLRRGGDYGTQRAVFHSNNVDQL